jgi:hypothetical protein
MLRTLIVILLGLAVGVGIGLATGWSLPVNSPQTAPSALSAEWQSDWVLMTAQMYHLDGDLPAAKQRLAPLGQVDPGALVAQRGEQAIAEGLPPRYIGTLARLAAALGARTPTLAPYLAK